MSSFSPLLDHRLKRLEGESTKRVLSLRQGMDFCSNDYLGFSQDQGLKDLASTQIEKIPLGSSGSRLLRGHLEQFERVEEVLADFSSRESALIFPTGYQANVGVLSAVLTPQDVVFSDQFNHASLIDGIKLSGARKEIYPHLDVLSLRKSLEKVHSEEWLKVIVTESVFSMEGDIAPLRELVELAEEFSALLIVDEAHAGGLWGDFEKKRGAGLVQALGLSNRVFMTIHPAGKAFGVGGAWVCGDAQLREYLINFCRSFIFSTAPSPFLSVLLESSIQRWREVGRERSKKVFENSRYLSSRLGMKGESPILPLVLGESARALQTSQRLREKGFDVRAIRPPTVPKGSARLRLTVQWGHTQENLDQLVLALEQGLV